MICTKELSKINYVMPVKQARKLNIIRLGLRTIAIQKRIEFNSVKTKAGEFKHWGE